MGEIIKAINANPETIQTFLTNLYVIPDYQSPAGKCLEEPPLPQYAIA